MAMVQNDQFWDGKIWGSTLQGTNISSPNDFWRCFSFYPGGTCQFPRGYRFQSCQPRINQHPLSVWWRGGLILVMCRYTTLTDRCFHESVDSIRDCQGKSSKKQMSSVQPTVWWFSLKGSLVGTVVVSVGLLGLFPPFSRVSGRCIYKPLLEENSPYTTSCTLSIPGVFLWYPPVFCWLNVGRTGQTWRTSTDWVIVNTPLLLMLQKDIRRSPTGMYI